MKEFEFIKKLGHIFGKDISGIGDDAAIIDNKYLISKDIMNEGVHFLNTTPMSLVLKKLFSLNVSDIAAMGGVAKYALLGVSTPDEAKLDEIANDIESICKRYNIMLIGGDTTRSESHTTLSLTIIGKCGKNILKRSGAKPGDILVLSRPVGLAKVSLEKELGNLHGAKIDKYLHYSLEAEDKLGKVLGEIPYISSCIDISDGLGIDASRIAHASNVKVVIEDRYLPYQNIQKFQINQQEYILSSGEELALLFTVPKNVIENVMENISSRITNNVIIIGKVESGVGTFLNCQNNMLKDVASLGYEHFNR